MGLTNLRHQGAAPGPAPAPAVPAPPAPPPASPEATVRVDLRRLTPWLDQLGALHHVTVSVLDAAGRTVAGPFHEPGFCRIVKSQYPEGCPPDCGQAQAGGAATWMCPYHLTCASVAVEGDDGAALSVLLGRTLGSQEELTRCLDTVEVVTSLGEEALAAAPALPWRSVEQFEPLAGFVRQSLRLMGVAPERPATPEKPKDLRQSRRNVSRG